MSNDGVSENTPSAPSEPAVKREEPGEKSWRRRLADAFGYRGNSSKTAEQVVKEVKEQVPAKPGASDALAESDRLGSFIGERVLDHVRQDASGQRHEHTPVSIDKLPQG